MQHTYILSAVRTPIGRFGGALKSYSPVGLAAPVMRAALERGGIEGGELDFYVFGNVLRGGHGQLIPRQAALQAGIPDAVDGMAVDMVCSSGMMSLMTASSLLQTGGARFILAGGTESMSTAGFHLSARARWGYKALMGRPEHLEDMMLRDGLTDPMSGEAMGVQAERLTAERGVSREALDEVALMSHHRAAEATRSGAFSREIIPVEGASQGDKLLEEDEGIRSDTSLAALGELKPAFAEEGLLTPGNSSQLSDGASALLLASEEAVAAHGLKPIARLLKGAWSAGEPRRFPEAPIPAVRQLTDQLGLRLGDVDLIENNEAFALSSVLFKRMLGVSYDRMNVHGGAIALGHPIGASGARITTTLIHALHHRDGQLGLAAICHGTGGGTVLAVERC